MEDHGNKWSFGAFLRFLRRADKDVEGELLLVGLNFAYIASLVYVTPSNRLPSEKVIGPYSW